MITLEEDLIYIPDHKTFDHVLNAQTGMVGRQLQARANRVMWAAKAQAGSKTGRLKMSIGTKYERTTKGPKILIGSNLKYALAHHEGTRPRLIVPKMDEFLKFTSRSGSVVFTRSVKNPGTRPNRYLTANLPLAVLPTMTTPGVTSIINI